MHKNVGTLHPTLRIVAGLAVSVHAATGTLGLWGWIGIVPLATRLMSWSPAYSLLGIKTCTTA